MMYSISEFSKLTGLSQRTLRFYEEKGLLSPGTRDFSYHRVYGDKELNAVNKIQFLKGCDFSIKEIQGFLFNVNSQTVRSLSCKLKEKFNQLDAQIESSLKKKNNILCLLNILESLANDRNIDIFQCKEGHLNFQKEMLEFVKGQNFSEKPYLDYIKREEACFDTPEKIDFYQKTKDIILYAKNEKIEIGFLRGGASSCLFLYKLGLNSVNPVVEGLFPERWFDSGNSEIHFDAEFSRAEEIQNYAERLNAELKFGAFVLFKSPILEIIKNTEQKIGYKPEYEGFDYDSALILTPFQKGDLEYVFGYDFGQSVLAKISDFKLQNDEEYMAKMNISKFFDIMNITTLVGREKEIFNARREMYLKATYGEKPYKNVPEELDELLESTYGMILYQEDVSSIIRLYTGWNYKKCDLSRRVLGKRQVESDLHLELKKALPQNIYELLMQETPYSFCKAHLYSERDLTRKTIYLREKHRDIYLNEIEKFEKVKKVPWAEMGFKTKEMRVLC